ncbi:MAG TPA: hypothetical protein VK762_17820 [Polyangiaceae bacterium]|nr:hypothetical protein [Polyangiaceae bacterium]
MRHSFFYATLVAVLAFIMGCGSSGSSTIVGLDGGLLDATFGDSGRKGDGAIDTGETFTVGGSVSGLSGNGLTLKNGAETLAVSASGTFTFKTPVASGAAYAVTVGTQPSDPTQTCSVTSGSGKATANVTDVAVMCVTGEFTVGGTVMSLSGTGLVLENNNTDDLTVSASGAFTFKTPVASGSAFGVTVKTQPTGPVQNCVVTGGTGVVGSGNITGVMVNCSTDTFTVGGQISGLAGGSVVLQDNAGDNLTVNANGNFAFATPVASGAAYAVTVLTQPSAPTQTCTVTTGSGSGTVAAANITSVRVTCTTNTYTVGGTVTGLAGTGLVLQDNAGDNLSVTASGTFTFATPVASGAAYAVTVLTQPTSPQQTCALTTGTGTGTVGGANVTTVAITCTTNAYTIGGTVTGLLGTGLVLQDNGGDDLGVTANGTFTFATPVVSGATFAVTVSGQPSGIAQTCVASGASGTVVGANVTSVTINCTTNTYTIGGTVSGLSGTGLVLQDNGGDNLTVTANGTFAFATPVASGAPYAVTVQTQPDGPAQTCVVASGSDTVGGANVTSVTVTCTTNKYTVGGTVSGLSGTGLVLQDNGGDNLAVTANGIFTFATAVPSGGTYAVTALTQPAGPSQTCAVTSGAATMGDANVTGVTVTCTINKYAVGGTVSGLAGTGLILQDNLGDNLTVTANGTFSFATSVASGGGYSVTTFQNPTTPSQTCVVTNGSGPVTNASITTVTVTCTTNKYTVGGTLTGLSAVDSVVLQDNLGDNLQLKNNGAFTFATSVASGAAYAVTVFTQPGAPAETCVVSGGSGTIVAANVTTVAVNCTVNKYTVGGTVSGLAGKGLVLQDNGGDNLSVTANGTFAFATPVSSGGPYAVTVLANPTLPSQTCTVTTGTGSGTVTNANVTTVAVTCVTNTYAIGGTLSGLAMNESVVLQDNLANSLTVGANGSFVFTTPIPSGSAYSVTVLTNPSAPLAQTCLVTSGGGSVVAANVTSVAVTCTTNTYTVGGTASGVVGTVVLLNNGGNPLTVSANGTFTFSTSILSGGTYAVTIQSNASNESCVLTKGTGSVTNANVTGVTLTCTACTDVALTATASVSSGGSVAPYTPSEANDGVTEAANCNAWAWVTAGNAPGAGQWIMYTWPTAQTISTIHMDTSSATVTDPCGNLGRTMGAAQIQWWNGAAWVTDGSVTNQQDDWDYTFTHPVTTTQLRLFDVYATNTAGFTANPMAFEWYAYSCH